jgi:hypothetical protein
MGRVAARLPGPILRQPSLPRMERGVPLGAACSRESGCDLGSKLLQRSKHQSLKPSVLVILRHSITEA